MVITGAGVTISFSTLQCHSYQRVFGWLKGRGAPLSTLFHDFRSIRFFT